MRQLATLPDAQTARIFTDYLLTLQIHSKLEQEPDGWVIWVRDEDELPRARQELEEFNRNPSDPRYASSQNVANNLRQRRKQEDAAYHRRQNRFNRRMSSPLGTGTITLGLIVICILVSVLSGGGDDPRIVQELSIAPYRFLEGGVELFGLGPTLQGQIWRLVTPIFLHFGIWHLLFDMYMLYYLGGAIEMRRGPLRYLALVLVLAVLSNLVQYYFGHPVLDGRELKWVHLPFFGGMSGVNYGLFGYMLMKARFQPELGLRLDPSTAVLLMVWLMACMTPFFPSIIGSGVANGAHLGGLIAGMIFGYVPTLWSSSTSA
ncbi:MAG TPA: rhomboid family intramembrane serine protease [Gemmataceae bacterium]|jgi:GlpG protein